MTEYDLCLAWNWEHDGAFVNLLGQACTAAGASLLQATPANLSQIVDGLNRGQLAFRALLDRVSEADPRFLAIVDWARARGAHSVNPYEKASRTWDKAKMHRAIFAEIHTPYTIVLPAYRAQPDLPPVDLTPLGPSFTIKPANGGGGAGVVVAASSLDQVRQARTEFAAEEYLLQTRIVPAVIGARPAWFRVLYCAGRIYPFWWATDTHVYTPVTVAQESHHGLSRLHAITKAIARICGLELFSTEIALDRAGTFLVVDYVNDPIDLRLQSQCSEGVPDEIVRFIAESLAALAIARRSVAPAAPAA